MIYGNEVHRIRFAKGDIVPFVDANNQIHFSNDERDSWTDWGLVPMNASAIALPEFKPFYMESDVFDGPGYDLTEASTGRVLYGSREGELKFIRQASDNWSSAISNIANWLQGQKVKLICEDDPFWYYTGRINVSVVSKEYWAEVTMHYTLEPYKLYINGSAIAPGALLWDTVNFNVIWYDDTTETTGRTIFEPMDHAYLGTPDEHAESYEDRLSAAWSIIAKHDTGEDADDIVAPPYSYLWVLTTRSDPSDANSWIEVEDGDRFTIHSLQGGDALAISLVKKNGSRHRVYAIQDYGFVEKMPELRDVEIRYLYNGTYDAKRIDDPMAFLTMYTPGIGGNKTVSQDGVYVTWSTDVALSNYFMNEGVGFSEAEYVVGYIDWLVGEIGPYATSIEYEDKTRTEVMTPYMYPQYEDAYVVINMIDKDREDGIGEEILTAKNFKDYVPYEIIDNAETHRFAISKSCGTLTFTNRRRSL